MTESDAAAIESEPESDGERRGGHAPVLHEVLARKVLHGHLHNRHQLMAPRLADVSVLPVAEAALLVRAMAAAAHADGALDAQEREIILGALASIEGLDVGENSRLARDLEQPPCIEALIRQVEPSSRTASRFYAVSLRVLDRQSPVNIAYLQYLALRLAVPRDIVVRLNRRYGLPALGGRPAPAPPR